jgi:hypothetical protein
MKTKTFQEVSSSKATDIFNGLRKDIDSESKTLDLDQLKGAVSLFSEKKNVKFDENIIRVINSFRNKNGKTDASYNDKLTDSDFKEFTTCKDIKALLFDKNSYLKNDHKEDLITLYTIMGGTREGISVDNLKNCLSKVMDMYNDPYSYFSNSYSQSSDGLADAQEIIDLLAESTDKLTLKEFLNIMTYDYSVDFDSLNLEDYIIKKNDK